MENFVYQLYSTNPWGEHSSRTNLGVYSDPTDALCYAVTKHQDHVCNALTNDGRLFVEAIELDSAEDCYEHFHDSDNDGVKNILYQIMVFELSQRWLCDLGFRANVSTDEEVESYERMEKWETYEDVEKIDIDLILGEDRDHDIIRTFLENDLAESI